MDGECSAFALELADAALGDPAGPLAAHLAGCAGCRSRVEAHRGLWSAVKALPRLDAAPHVRAAVLAAAAGPSEAPAPSSATGRDVRSQVMAAARKSAAGRPPQSLERFRQVPAAMTAPGTVAPARSRWPRVALAVAALVVAVISAVMIFGPGSVADTPPPPPEPPLVEAPPPAPPPEPPPAAEENARPVRPVVQVPAGQPVLAVVCTCRRPEEVAARNAFLASSLRARALRPDDPALETAEYVFAIGAGGLDAALALPQAVPIVYALVPGTYPRPQGRKAVELGSPTSEQLEELERRVPGRRRIGVVSSPTVSLDAIARASPMRVAPEPSAVRSEARNVDLFWIIGLEGRALDDVVRAADGVPVAVTGTRARADAFVSFVLDPARLGFAAADVAAGRAVSWRPYEVQGVQGLPEPGPEAPREPAAAPGDARVAFLGRQLKAAREPMLRAQTLQLLGIVGGEEAVTLMCGALSDPDVRVRLAAVNGLSTARLESATRCLQSHNDPVRDVQARINLAPGVVTEEPGIRTLWRAKCASCHGEDGKAQTKQGKKHQIEDMSSVEWQTNWTDEKMKKVILEGSENKKEMKAFKGKISDGELEGLIQHIRAFKP